MFKALTAIIGAIGVTVAGTLLFGNKNRENEENEANEEQETKIETKPMNVSRHNGKLYAKAYVLMMQMVDEETKECLDFDVFGLYTSYELADKAREWRKREDGLYQGCTPKNVYNYCYINTRLIDCNLPEEEEI